jgi:Phosphotransferase enzyme family
MATATAELHGSLERLLIQHYGRHVRISQLDRRPSEYRSSFKLEELDVRLDDGARLRLVWKDVGRGALSGEASRAKPIFLWDPLREIETNRLILAPCGGLGAPDCFGAIADPTIDRYWLFLEHVSGLALSQVGDFFVWQEAARWLARLHNRFASLPLALARSAHLLIHDSRFFELWIGRAREFLQQNESRLAAELQRIDRLAERYDRVVARLAELPASLLHGDFFASNILIDQSGPALRISPVDWEMSAIGPRGIDLAALVAGHWTDDERHSLAMAYFGEAAMDSKTGGDADDFHTGLQYCRLHLAVQMLGWSPTWQPNWSHAYDWLAEAIRLADELQIG